MSAFLATSNWNAPNLHTKRTEEAMKKVTKKAAQVAYNKIPEPGFHIEALFIIGFLILAPIVAMSLT